VSCVSLVIRSYQKLDLSSKVALHFVHGCMHLNVSFVYKTELTLLERKVLLNSVLYYCLFW
jgi:hypothetical protein